MHLSICYITTYLHCRWLCCYGKELSAVVMMVKVWAAVGVGCHHHRHYSSEEEAPCHVPDVCCFNLFTAVAAVGDSREYYTRNLLDSSCMSWQDSLQVWSFCIFMQLFVACIILMDVHSNRFFSNFGDCKEGCPSCFQYRRPL